jgi:hypothetical protein
MSKEELISYWRNAGQLLGFSIEAPCNLRLPSGIFIDAAALLPDFGARNGMLLISSYDEIQSYLDEINSAGYAFSVLGPFVEFQVDCEAVIDSLRDWGWTARTPPPSWLK